jgi:hypothetical protein
MGQIQLQSGLLERFQLYSQLNRNHQKDQHHVAFVYALVRGIDDISRFSGYVTYPFF